MKRLAAVILVLLLLAAPGCADERNLGTKWSDYWYDLNDDGTARLTACFNVEEILELSGELDGFPLTVIGNHAFLYYSPAHVVIPDGVAELQTEAFHQNEMIISVTLPDSLVVMDGNPFVNCPNLAEIIISDEHPVFAIIDGMLVHKEENRIICPVNGSGEVFVIPESVEVIADRAFYENQSIKQITLHDNIIAIGDLAFAGCTSLERIDIPASVTEIGIYALDGPGIVGVYRDSYAEEYCIANEIPYEYMD